MSFLPNMSNWELLRHQIELLPAGDPARHRLMALITTRPEEDYDLKIEIREDFNNSGFFNFAFTPIYRKNKIEKPRYSINLVALPEMLSLARQHGVAQKAYQGYAREHNKLIHEARRRLLGDG